jgi:hypothetical protein
MSRIDTFVVQSTAALLLATLIVTALPTSAPAQGLQGRTRIVLRGGYDSTRDAGGIGGAVRIPVAGAFEVIPSGDYFIVDLGDAWQANLDGAIRFGGSQLFYVGTGVAVLGRSFNGLSNTDVGWNLFAGLAAETPGGRFGIIIEPRYTLRDGSDPFWMTLGVSYAIGS